jgi:hypothetical protein
LLNLEPLITYWGPFDRGYTVQPVKNVYESLDPDENASIDGLDEFIDVKVRKIKRLGIKLEEANHSKRFQSHEKQERECHLTSFTKSIPSKLTLA